MEYAKLRGEIRARFRTNETFAHALNISPASLSAKLNGKREWKSNEIARACALLHIPLERAHDYFFYFES
jgi:hypothetical protein